MLDALLADYENGYCPDLFLKLARAAPGELIALMRGGSLGALDLSYGAEALGQGDDARGEATLTHLLGHQSAVVREGAALGLFHLSQRLGLGETARNRLATVAAGDPSPAVRDAADEVLDLAERQASAGRW